MAQDLTRRRKREDIDGHSYIEAYDGSDTKDFVLFVHGILGDHKETWSATPAQLMTEAAMSQTDYGSFGYATRVFDRTRAQMQAEQLMPWMRQHLNRYEHIFIVAHSMGGLIVREACGRLAMSKRAEDRALFSKIRHGFFVAVPLAGSPVARFLNRLPLVGRINRKIPILANPQVAGQDLAEFYEQAIVKAECAGLCRPRFSLYIGGGDRLVGRPPEWVMTRDDVYEGVLEGSHSSIKSDQSANSTLIRFIVHTINSYRIAASVTGARIAGKALSDDGGRPSRRHVSGAVRDVLLIPCSATKFSGNNELHPMTGGMQHALASPRLAATALQMRCRIKGLIESGRLRGQEFQEGNRLTRQQNKSLHFGPDFGGKVNEKRYLPAYKRYIGRCYQASSREWDEFFALPENTRPDLLIISGLYGLFPADEHIQNYDCHLTDIDSEAGRSISGYWQEIITDLLISHLEWLQSQNWRVGRVIDLLAEDVYHAMIDWERIYPLWPVLHQVFEKSSGREALDNVGIWLHHVVRNPNVLSGIVPEQFYDDPEFLGLDRVGFETRLRSSQVNFPVVEERAGAHIKKMKTVSPERQRSLDDYELIRTIYKGHHSRVLKCRIRSTGNICVVKETDLSQVCLKALHAIKDSKWPNVAAPKYIWEKDGRLYEELPYVGGIRLSDAISPGLGGISGSILDCFHEQMLKLLRELHNAAIIHRDIHPDNIFMVVKPVGEVVPHDVNFVEGPWEYDSFGRDAESFFVAWVLVDCTFATLLSEASKSCCSHDPYTSIEQVTSGATPASDMYALGATLYYGITGTNIPSFQQRLNKLESLMPFPEAGHPSVGFPRYLKKLLALDPHERPSADYRLGGDTITQGYTGTLRVSDEAFIICDKFDFCTRLVSSKELVDIYTRKSESYDSEELRDMKYWINRLKLAVH